MRVIAGSAKGRRIGVPKGRGTRPTADRVRRALFDSLDAQLEGTRFLDLFAGSGAVGIEALSRGASECVFVERSRRVAEAILANLSECRLGEFATVLALQIGDALAHLAAEGQPFDFIFLDPPYADAAAYAQTLEQLAALPALFSPRVQVIVQHLSKLELPEHAGALTRTRVRHFGETALTTYERSPEGLAA